MRDLLPEILAAREKAPLWSREGLAAVMRQVEGLGGGIRADWDKGAGEAWASFATERKWVGMVGANLPLAFFVTGYPARLMDGPVGEWTHVVTVNDYEAVEWRVDLQALAETLPEEEWQWLLDLGNPDIDPTAFSVADLYWATV